MLNKFPALLNRIKWEISNIPPFKEMKSRAEVGRWLDRGKLGPAPHAVKQANLKRLAKTLDINVFVETGTFRANMLLALHSLFAELYSIELSPALHAYSKARCENYHNIEIMLGDSSEVLGRICSTLSGQVLFWLDGHYSGGDTAKDESISPIISELCAIRKAHEIEPIIVIDDARLFAEKHGYPEISDILEISANWPRGEMYFSVHDDAIYILPQYLVARLAQQELR